MDQDPADVLLKVARVSSWEKAKAYLITLAATVPQGSVQYQQLTDAIDQFVTHIEDNSLQQ
ncbi:hypothetical protein HYP85_gp013 [Pseudomonas phage Zuri]|uniref:Uncharacterized protein n=1 Tax=Pseudomonas phage Zuri TaxID=2604899 RepID=A0A5C1K597_9CAUD|nr:hypothetical protein HYP85_gp013 [Pseudomonas phage Zuri]QEM41110.1 hypothetical protein Zuri_13 [Pseudomonas phage Zuri]